MYYIIYYYISRSQAERYFWREFHVTSVFEANVWSSSSLARCRWTRQCTPKESYMRIGSATEGLCQLDVNSTTNIATSYDSAFGLDSRSFVCRCPSQIKSSFRKRFLLRLGGSWGWVLSWSEAELASKELAGQLCSSSISWVSCCLDLTLHNGAF